MPLSAGARVGPPEILGAASIVVCAVLLSSASPGRVRAQPAAGAIAGHVTLAGKLVGNPIIRMGVDPKCAEINAGKQVFQESAVVALDGSVGNVFVALEGTFPPTPVPSQPVVIAQHACLYGPRVIGMRVGQALQIRNEDDLLHNVHSLSIAGNVFNVGQPKAGIVFVFVPNREEMMLKLACDVHRWMTAYVGVMSHPYFAVSDSRGNFQIANVPPGTYRIKAWHERFGESVQSVIVKAGESVTANFSYQSPSK